MVIPLTADSKYPGASYFYDNIKLLAYFYIQLKALYEQFATYRKTVNRATGYMPVISLIFCSQRYYNAIADGIFRKPCIIACIPVFS